MNEKAAAVIGLALKTALGFVRAQALSIEGDKAPATSMQELGELEQLLGKAELALTMQDVEPEPSGVKQVAVKSNLSDLQMRALRMVSFGALNLRIIIPKTTIDSLLRRGFIRTVALEAPRLGLEHVITEAGLNYLSDVGYRMCQFCKKTIEQLPSGNWAVVGYIGMQTCMHSPGKIVPKELA